MTEQTDYNKKRMEILGNSDLNVEANADEIKNFAQYLINNKMSKYGLSKTIDNLTRSKVTKLAIEYVTNVTEEKLEKERLNAEAAEKLNDK